MSLVAIHGLAGISLGTFCFDRAGQKVLFGVAMDADGVGTSLDAPPRNGLRKHRESPVRYGDLHDARTVRERVSGEHARWDQ